MPFWVHGVNPLLFQVSPMVVKNVPPPPLFPLFLEQKFLLIY